MLNSPSPSVISVHATALVMHLESYLWLFPKLRVYPSSTSHSFATNTACVLSDISVIVKLVCHSYISEMNLTHTDLLHTTSKFLVKARMKYLIQVHRKLLVNPLNHRQVLSKFGIHLGQCRGKLKMNRQFQRCCFLGIRHLSQS